jgi:hypothetical protein
MTDLIKRDDAPEKIVAWGWESPKTSGCYPHECHWMGAGYAHYIRADLIDPAAIREAAWVDALDAAHEYTLTQYGMGFLKHPVDRERILALIGEKNE